MRVVVVTVPSGAIVTCSSPASLRSQVVIDALGRRTTLSYNALGYVTTIQNALGAISSFGYDSFYNQVTVTDPLGASEFSDCAASSA